MKCATCRQEIGTPAYQVAEITDVHVLVANVCRHCFHELVPRGSRHRLFDSPLWIDKLTGERFSPQPLPGL